MPIPNFWADPLGAIAAWLHNLLTGWGLLPSAATVILQALGGLILGSIALVFCLFLIWYERRILARMQDRIGPNRVGPQGLLQTVADAIKLLGKEDITPIGADRLVYNLAPVMAAAAVISLWAVIPFAVNVMGARLNVGALYLVAVGGLGTLAIMMAGWSSNNKYALLGAFRTVAQLVSYEAPMILALLVPVMLARSMDLNEIVRAQHVWFIVAAPIAGLIFFLSSQAEVGRGPFDLLEAESEIVAGFNIEYSGMKFGMFFVGEFLHAFTIGMLFAVLFLGGWQGPGAERYPLLGVFYFVAKAFFAYFFSILARGALPRIRIDHMLDFNWKFLVPVALAAIVVTMLTDKLVDVWAPGAGAWLRAGALFLANLLLALVILAVLQRTARRLRAAEHGELGGPGGVGEVIDVHAGHTPTHGRAGELDTPAAAH